MKPLHPLQIPPGFKPVKFKSKTSNSICYIIYCDKTGKQYVGSGKSGRVWKHFNNGKGNEKLYEDFRKFGEESFKFWISDFENLNAAREQEQVLLDSLIKTHDKQICHPDYYYNVMIKVGGGNTYDSENLNDLRKAKPYELRDAITHELIHRFRSLNKEEILGHFNNLKTSGSVQKYLQDKASRRVPLCFWNFGKLRYLCYENETIEELEIRTGRNFIEDRNEGLKFISKVTVRDKEGKKYQLSGYDNYPEAAKKVGLRTRSQGGNFGKLIQGKRKSCAGWVLHSIP